MDAPQLVWIGMGMDDHLARPGRGDQPIAIGRHIPQPCAKSQQAIALSQHVRQMRVHPESQIAHIMGVTVVHAVHTPETGCHRHPQAAGHLRQIVASGL